MTQFSRGEGSSHALTDDQCGGAAGAVPARFEHTGIQIVMSNDMMAGYLMGEHQQVFIKHVIIDQSNIDDVLKRMRAG